jgi:hypothetical protein
MAGSPQQLEWYIARDGAQHGPIADNEMRKFVELGHLKPTDLVWCASFTEWVPGAQAFPELLRSGSGDSSNPPVPAPSEAPQRTRQPASVRVEATAAAPSQAFAADANRGGMPRRSSPDGDPRQPAPHGAAAPEAATARDRDVTRPSRQPVGMPSQGAAQRPGPDYAPNPEGGAGPARGRQVGGIGFGQLGPAPGGFGPMAREPGFDDHRAARVGHRGPDEDHGDDGRPPRSSRVGRIAKISMASPPSAT